MNGLASVNADMDLARLLRLSLAAGLAAVTFGVAAPADAQNYTPESSNRFPSTIIVNAGGNRVNSQQTITGRIGVEDCRELEDERIRFRYEVTASSQAARFTNIEFAQVRVVEFARDQAAPSDCTPPNPSGCAQLNDNTVDNPATTLDIQPLPGQFLNSARFQIEVSVEFGTLMALNDEREEVCQFTDAADPATPTSDTGMNTGDTALGDAGSRPPRGETEGDRLYVSRIFINGLQTVNDDVEAMIDAPLLLDRTRPSRPSDVRAAATENVLKTRFVPPKDDSDVDDYHVFYSNEQMGQNLIPEQLGNRENVEQRTLTSVSEKDNGDLTGRITGVSQNVGDPLYIAVVSEDRAGNFSELRRTERPADVQQSIDFWEQYKQAGGAEPGGCACRQTDGRMPVGFLLAIVGLGGLVAVQRRGRTS